MHGSHPAGWGEGMSFEDRFGITDIINEHSAESGEALSISWDVHESDFEDVADRFACILYTPDMSDKMIHHHIELTDEQAVSLRDWLIAYLDMKANGLDQKTS